MHIVQFSVIAAGLGDRVHTMKISIFRPKYVQGMESYRKYTQ
jgi:hypothetical protein